jgi:ribonucleotide monophosphatase NagD (HAD superfamily)
MSKSEFDGGIAALIKEMKTVWVRQGYAVYQSIDDESKRPDYIVDSIEELRELGEKFFENN